MVVPSHRRTREEMLAPFGTSALRSQWRVLSCSITPVGDAAHDQFVRDGDPKALAAKRAGLIRATTGPILASSLGSGRTDDDRREFLTQFERRLRERIEGVQRPIAYAVGTLALGKAVAGSRRSTAAISQIFARPDQKVGSSRCGKSRPNSPRPAGASAPQLDTKA
jgi:hypothetical protein